MIRINLIAEEKGVSAAPAAEGAAGGGGLNLGGRANEFILLGVLLVVVAVLGFQFWSYNSTLKERRAERQDLQRQKAELQKYIDEVNKLERKRDELQRRIEIIDELKRNQKGPVRIMDEISRALPELVWLEQMQLAGSEITVRGTAMDENAVANYISNLDESPFFQEPEFLTQMRRAGEEDTFDFTLSTIFVNEPASPDAG